MQVENCYFGKVSDRPRWLISINDSGYEAAKILDPFFEQTLVLFFDDVTSLINLPPQFKRMNQKDLNQLVDFIIKAKQAQVDLFVHCHAGVCRSGAVVEVLKEHGWEVLDRLSGERFPNHFVYDRLKEALEN